MSAFSAYGGAYEFEGREYRWRCYATARVHAVRKREHGRPHAPKGLKWITVEGRHKAESELTWLLDEHITDFSQMLVQVESARGQRPEAPALAQAQFELSAY